jgi:hypothetical protein
MSVGGGRLASSPSSLFLSLVDLTRAQIAHERFTTYCINSSKFPVYVQNLRKNLHHSPLPNIGHNECVRALFLQLDKSSTMTEGAVVVKTRKFKRNPLLSRRQVCIAKKTRKKEQKETPWRAP